VSPAEALRGKINNFFLDIQTRAWLFHNPRARALRVYQENPGKDASVDIHDLKQKMLWCYNNREAAEAMGLRAREYALREWSLDRMKRDFQNNILPLLERGLHARNS